MLAVAEVDSCLKAREGIGLPRQPAVAGERAAVLVGMVECVAPVVCCAGVESLGVGVLFVAVVVVPEAEVPLGFQVAGFPLLLAVVPGGVEACLAGGVVSGQILPAAPVSAQRGFALVVEVVGLPEGGEREI